MTMARSEAGGHVQRLVENSPLARRLVRRHIAGETPEQAVAVVGGLAAEGLPATIEYLGERAPHRPRRRRSGRRPETAGGTGGPAGRTVAAYLRLLDLLAARGLAGGTDLTVDVGALGLLAGEPDQRGVIDGAARVCEAARSAGATVTLDLAEWRVPAERMLAVHAVLLKDHPDVGVTVPACLRAADEYCRLLSGARVRLRRGVRAAPAAVAHRDARDIDQSFVRCLRILMAGTGYPMIATQDRRMLEIASVLAILNERGAGGLEYQMPYGARLAERRPARPRGATLRVHVPYGSAWYGYLLRRL